METSSCSIAVVKETRTQVVRDTPKATEWDWFNGIFHGNGSESNDEEKNPYA